MKDKKAIVWQIWLLFGYWLLVIVRFQNGSDKVANELRDLQFWSEKSDRMTSDQIALHSVQLPLLIKFDKLVGEQTYAKIYYARLFEIKLYGNKYFSEYEISDESLDV